MSGYDVKTHVVFMEQFTGEHKDLVVTEMLKDYVRGKCLRGVEYGSLSLSTRQVNLILELEKKDIKAAYKFYAEEFDAIKATPLFKDLLLFLPTKEEKFKLDFLEGSSNSLVIMVRTPKPTNTEQESKDVGQN